MLIQSLISPRWRANKVWHSGCGTARSWRFARCRHASGMPQEGCTTIFIEPMPPYGDSRPSTYCLGWHADTFADHTPVAPKQILARSVWHTPELEVYELQARIRPRLVKAALLSLSFTQAR